VKWYCTVLGCRIAHRSGQVAFLTYDEEHHRIALLATSEFGPKPEGPTVGFAHAAFAFDSLAELFGTYVRLRDAGILPVRSINHGPTVSFYYADPDANQIEFQVDSFPDAQATNAWMESEAFRRNPIGIEFDPEDMLARLRRGVPEVELMRRPDTV
jgi:catechol-2,3-dioxygenase